MEITIVVLVILAVTALYGVGGYLVRDFGQQVLTRDVSALASEIQSRQDAALDEARADLDRLKSDIRSVTSEADAQLARVRQRRDAAQAELDATLAKARDELAQAERARTEAERVLADARESAAAVAAIPPPPPLAHELIALAPPAATPNHPPVDPTVGSRVLVERLETVGELYVRLARVDTALSQLTTPILLPGEPYEAPEEFPVDALRWDNWKDVGETAYALGEYLTEHRLRIPAATASEFERGVTALRIALTRSIYPNLNPVATAEQETMLRAGLDRLAHTLPRLRGLLEAEYRALSGEDRTGDAPEPGAGAP